MPRRVKHPLPVKAKARPASKRRSDRKREAAIKSSTPLSSSVDKAPAGLPPAESKKPKRKGFTLMSLPEEVLQIIYLFILDAPDRTGTLANQSLGNFEYALWLAKTHPRLLRALQFTVHSLSILWNDSTAPDEIATVAKSLKHVSISGHPRAHQFLEPFLGQPSRLESLHLNRVSIAADVLTPLLTPIRLKSLCLSFVTLPNLPTLLTGIAPSLCSLTKLQLRGLCTLDENTLVAICKSASTSLTSISLCYLRDNSITDCVLERVAAACPNITDIILEDLYFLSAVGVYHFCILYCHQLTALHLRSMGVTSRHLKAIVTASPFLTELGVQDSYADLIRDSDNPVEAFTCHTPKLRVVDIRSISSFNDWHVAQLVQSTPLLHSLTLRFCLKVTDDAVSVIVNECGDSLRKLDFRGCLITDVGLRCIGLHCKALEEIALGSDGNYVFPNDVQNIDPFAVSNEGMGVLLKGCGQSLKRFFWETPQVLPGNGPVVMQMLGVDRLDAKALALALGAFCPNLIRVEVNELRPPATRKSERAECDLAFFDLDRKLRHITIFLDKDPL